MQWNINREDVVCSGNEKPHKCFRTFRHKTGYKNVLENLKAQSDSSPGGQHGSFDISVKDGRFPEFKLVQLKEIWDHLLQCGITLTAEYLPSKLNVTVEWESRNNSDSSELKLAPQSFQRNPRDRSICFQIISSDQDLHFVEARSIDPSSRCLPTRLVPQESYLYAFPLFWMIPKDLSKVR